MDHTVALSEQARHNDDLYKYLLRYCTTTIPPYYAVMVGGPWGSGKTWFIKKLVEMLPKSIGEKTLYVSLYGVSKIADIEDAFFQQLYPRLSNKKVQFGYSLLKGFIKGALKVDLNGDGKSDGTLNITLPQLEKFAADPHNMVLIFDDLERAKLDPVELLGYINQFVEHEGCRVIVVANEANLHQRSKDFRATKEKLIGRTFEIAPEPYAALNKFIPEAVTGEVAAILSLRKQTIVEAFDRAGHRNLRHLRQAMLDFSDIWNCLSVVRPDLHANKKFVDKLVDEVTSIAIEYRAGTLPREHIGLPGKDLRTEQKATANDSTDVLLQASQEILDRHRLNGLASALQPSVYEKFFTRGHLSERSAREAITSSFFFTDESKPVWQQLWHRLKLGDERFEVLQQALLSDFLEHKITDQGTLMHAFGILLDSANLGLLGQSTANVLAAGKQVLGHLSQKGLLDTGLRNGVPLPDTYGYMADGLEYRGRHFPEFREFRESLEEAQASMRAVALAKWADQWLQELKVNPDLWASHITEDSEETSWYRTQAVFAVVPAQRFVDLVLTLEASALQVLSNTIQRRYLESKDPDAKWKLRELPFWKTCQDLMLKGMAKKKATALSTIFIKHQLTEDIDEIVAVLSHHQEAWDEAVRQFSGKSKQKIDEN